MTPAELEAHAPRALSLLQDLYPVVQVFTKYHVELVARALAEAVAQEREACLLAVESIDVDANSQLDDGHEMWNACAAAIRARAERGEVV